MTLAKIGKYLRNLPVLLALCAVVLLSACEGVGQGSPATPATPGPKAFKCPGDDHALQEISLGWSFCYPSIWRYRERFQPSSSPKGVDTTLDVVVVSPTPGPDQGEFGFVIIGSYESDGLTLNDWVAKNLGTDLKLDPIQWGNADSAAQIEGQLTRVAISGNRIYELDLHQGAGNLSLDDAMKSRLGSWRFGV
jgi:hypothetical protein